MEKQEDEQSKNSKGEDSTHSETSKEENSTDSLEISSESSVDDEGMEESTNTEGEEELNELLESATHFAQHAQNKKKPKAESKSDISEQSESDSDPIFVMPSDYDSQEEENIEEDQGMIEQNNETDNQENETTEHGQNVGNSADQEKNEEIVLNSDSSGYEIELSSDTSIGDDVQIIEPPDELELQNMESARILQEWQEMEAKRKQTVPTSDEETPAKKAKICVLASMENNAAQQMLGSVEDRQSSSGAVAVGCAKKEKPENEKEN